MPAKQAKVTYKKTSEKSSSEKHAEFFVLVESEGIKDDIFVLLVYIALRIIEGEEKELDERNIKGLYSPK